MNFANGNALTHILAHPELLGALDPDKILLNKCTPTVALLLRVVRLSLGPSLSDCFERFQFIFLMHSPQM